MDSVLQIDVCTLPICASVKHLVTSGLKNRWKNFHTKFDGILSSLRRHKDIVECRASLAQYRLYQEDAAEYKTKLEESILREETKKLMVVKEWLAVGELPQLDHSSFCMIRTECATTTRWITQHEIVKNWIQADVPMSPVVWMYGIPGAGQYSRCNPLQALTNIRKDYIVISNHRRVQKQARLHHLFLLLS
jgi:hypothetical protein